MLRPVASSVESYALGSHVNVGVLIEGRPETRSYSLVGGFNPDGYRIAVRRAPDSRGGSNVYVDAEAGGAHRGIQPGLAARDRLVRNNPIA